MSRILFTHSYFMRFDPKQWAAGQPYPPLGTITAASVLREKGHEVSLFDTMFAYGPEEAILSLKKNKPAYFVVYDDGFNYLTKMCLTNMREAAFEMMKYAAASGCIVIMASSDSNDHYEQYLEEGADFVLLGEAEKTLEELLEALEKPTPDLLSIPGLAFRQQHAVIKTAKRQVMHDLDDIPLPAWDLVDMEAYKKTWLKHRGFFSLNMATTRGCPFKCNWCAKPIYGNRYNTRSAENVVRELKMLKEKYAFDHIWFCDDIFGLKPGWLANFAELVEQEKIDFHFKIQGRVDLMMQENYILDLARAGCRNVWMGAESGSQKILDAMDKGTRVEQIFAATELLKKHGIHPSFFIQFGYPGETREDILKTIEMINDLLPYEIGISVSYPLPGTAFFDRVKSELLEKTNWTDSDELALMFRNTYSPPFYKQLYRYVHANYRKHLAMESIRRLFGKGASFSMKRIKKALSLFYYTPATWLARQKLNKLEQPVV